MTPFKIHSNATRRGFLAGCAACAAGALCPAVAEPAPQEAANGEKVKVRLVFSHPPKDRQGWPYVNFDYETMQRDLTARLRESCPFAEFEPVTVVPPDDAKKLLENDQDVDGYLVYLLGIPGGAGRTIALSGRRTILVNHLFGGTGEFLSAYGPARKKGLPVAGVSSSRFQDVVQAVKALDCVKKMRSSVILDVTPRNVAAAIKQIQDDLGTEVRQVPVEELNALYEKVNLADAQKRAASWIQNAQKVVEPTREEIVKSAKIYFAMQELMQQAKSRAIAVNCLGLFYAGKMPAYPCLGFFQFNNDGLVGACEADLQSTVSMLLMSYLVGRPGYISDPVIDTSKNQIIYSHCVAPNKVYGPKGTTNPYQIRSHSEDRKGAAIRSIMPVGAMTTSLKFIPGRKEVVLHQAKTVGNVDEDKACRSKLAAEVKDANKLLLDWDYGWHRVTFFGDHRQAVEAVSALLGFKVVLEG